jgi:YebC/PmpR family DNA-binding regulatory protein
MGCRRCAAAGPGGSGRGWRFQHSRHIGGVSRIPGMSGHSKWASIKHKKAATDAKRGQLFTKLARAIAVAAREGGGDPDSNFTLAAAVEKAKSYSMPKDNIQRAIDRGTGAGAGDEQIERVVYEGYGPCGAAVLVDTLTDNRNRTGAEVRNLFDKSGGNLGEPGSVAWQFEKKGVILVDGERYSEDDLIAAIDAGADDVVPDDDVLKVTTAPADLAAVRAALEAAGVEVQSSELAMEPNAVVEIATESEARALVRLMEALDDHDDVEAVHANFDIPEALLEQAAA